MAKCILIDEDGKYTLNQRICCLRNYLFNPIFFYYLLNRHEYFLSFNDGKVYNLIVDRVDTMLGYFCRWADYAIKDVNLDEANPTADYVRLIVYRS